MLPRPDDITPITPFGDTRSASASTARIGPRALVIMESCGCYLASGKPLSDLNTRLFKGLCLSHVGKRAAFVTAEYQRRPCAGNSTVQRRIRRSTPVSEDKPKADYVIGNKKPPRGRPFQKGKSGNPSGRPKNLSRFGDVLMKEFFKPVVAQVGGKTVRKSQVELVAQQMVRDAITKGPQARALLLKVIEAHEAREVAKEALQAKKLAQGTVDVDWTAEHEKLFQRIAAANEKFKQ